MSLNCGGLGIERYPVRLHQFGEKFARLVLGLYEPVIVRDVGERLRGVGRRFRTDSRRLVTQQLAGEPVELELCAHLGELVAVDAVKPVVVPVGLDRHIGAYRREKLRHAGVFRAEHDLLREFALQLLRVGDYAFDIAEARKQVVGSLLADAANPGYVVGGIARESKVVYHLPGIAQMPVSAYLGGIVYLRTVSGMRGTVEADPWRD